MKTLNLIGFDFGASSGRAMLGIFDGKTLKLEEIHRFSNDPVSLNGHFVWDVPRFVFDIKAEFLNGYNALIRDLQIDLVGLGIILFRFS